VEPALRPAIAKASVELVAEEPPAKVSTVLYRIDE
jgi:hypothetical protein